MKKRGKNKSTLILESAIHDIVEERAPIIVRGVAYALFTQNLISSMETKNTGKVSRLTTAMRECGELDWRKIVDDSRATNRVNAWDNPSEIIEATVAQYRRNYWQDQEQAVEIWAEKGTVYGVLEPVLKEFGVTFRVMKGFGSFTMVKQAAVDSRRLSEEKDFTAFYIGDHDPSGMYMTEVDLPERLSRYGAHCKFKRIAVTEQDFHLPKFDARTKKKDPRYQWFVDRYGYDCWELDAINPNDLRQRVREQIESCIDLPKWKRAIAVEAAEVESMRDFHERWKEMMG